MGINQGTKPQSRSIQVFYSIKNMIVAGVDPGTRESAIVVWDGTKVIFREKIPNRDAKEFLRYDLMSQTGSTHAALENVQCMGQRVGSEVFDTARILGAFEYIIDEELGIPYELVKRTDIKKHHCGKAVKIKDKDIRNALILRLGAPGTKAKPGVTYGVTSDCWSALAIATFYYDTHKND